MNNDDLVLRQQHLLVRSAQLRLALANQTQVLKKPLALADQAQTTLSWLYRNPQWPLGALLMLIVIRPRRTMLWGGRLWWGWKTFSKVKKLMQRHTA